MLICSSLDPPIIEPTQTVFEVNVSESVTFICNTKPYPRVTNLVWEKEIDGVTTYVNTVHMSTSLTLTNLNMDDSGIYRCIANNSAGSTNMSFTLQVTTGNVQYSIVKCSANLDHQNRLKLYRIIIPCYTHLQKKKCITHSELTKSTQTQYILNSKIILKILRI